ncbi:uncharacterized protein C18orf8 isoform X3 [Ananas comosus]|uniref:Uncharacterized protein C18orf8 isoform X3 n=1 Tax=Ananas comosus TaxID=4615 RepID=A0A6P5GGI3_ANACO|nr:uncharacterized protein C18orf8 isoform X3 [Ananas comosus]XP_020104455.1 uncharacterized protein C18orf8 isoform X3 [Ananas comosus]
MFGKVSSGQGRVSLSGSGALSHVYIQHPLLRCNIPEIQGLFYDDGNKLILAPTSDQVLSWKIGQSTQLDPPNSDPIGEGPVVSIRYSLDQKIIGIQRSNHEVEFRNRETGQAFFRRCRPDSESILGFFWTDCPSCDIILIKTSGIDLLVIELELNTLQLVEAKKFSVSWYVYTHESRMVLLASGMQCSIFSAYQFSSGGIVRLPKFEMTMTKSEANQKPVLASDDVHIVTIYGRIYCLQLDRVGMVLYLYRFYRDAVVQQGTLPIYSSRIAVSVVDNVLLVHQVDAKVVILYDIFLDSLTPISAPLPLLLRGTSGNSRQTGQVEDSLSTSYGGMLYGDSWNFLVPDLICDVDNGLLWRICLDLEAIATSSSDVPSILEFLQRRRSDPSMIKSLCLTIMRTVILERRAITTAARAIDVLVASHSHEMKTKNALQGGERKTSEQTHNSGMRQESLTEVAKEPTKGTEHEPVENSVESTTRRNLLGSDSDNDTRREIGGINSEQFRGKSLHASDIAEFEQPSQSEGPGSSRPLASHQQGSQSTRVSISPNEMYHFVFAHVEDEMGGDPSYLVAIIIEFLQSVSKEKLAVHANLYVMMIQLLARANRFAEVALFVSNKILEPSKEVAFQLLESGQQNLLARKLGRDMLRQMSLHHDFVIALLQDGYYLEALRYARKYKVITVRPALFLEAAFAANNSQHLAAVLRFFSDFTPSFKTTSEYDRE